MKVSEIEELSDFKLAIMEVETQIELSKKSLELDVTNFKHQITPTNIVSSLCEKIGDRVTLLLLNLISKIVDNNK